jgi:hypothetical protein
LERSRLRNKAQATRCQKGERGVGPWTSTASSRTPHRAWRLEMCSLHGRHPKPPSRGAPGRRVEDTPGRRRRGGWDAGSATGADEHPLSTRRVVEEESCTKHQSGISINSAWNKILDSPYPAAAKPLPNVESFSLATRSNTVSTLARRAGHSADGAGFGRAELVKVRPRV